MIGKLAVISAASSCFTLTQPDFDSGCRVRARHLPKLIARTEGCQIHPDATGVTGNAWRTGCHGRSGCVTTERSAVVTQPGNPLTARTSGRFQKCQADYLFWIAFESMENASLARAKRFCSDRSKLHLYTGTRTSVLSVATTVKWQARHLPDRVTGASAQAAVHLPHLTYCVNTPAPDQGVALNLVS